MSSENDDILTGVFLFGFGIWSFFWGFKRLRRKRMIENIPTSTIRGLALGLVEIIGKAKKSNLIISPLTKTECVFYQYTVERYESRGRSGSWVTVANGNSFSCPFWLEDLTGKILVFGQGAELVMPCDYTYANGWCRPLSNNLISFLEENAITYRGAFGSTHQLRFKEWYVREGEKVYVLGTAKKQVEQSLIEEELKTMNPGECDDVVIAQGEEEKLFLISDQGQSQLIRKLSWQSFYGVFGGVVLSLVMLGYLLFRFGIFN